MTFEDLSARDTYLDHPQHKLVGEKLVGALAGGMSGLLVFDLKLSAFQPARGNSIRPSGSNMKRQPRRQKRKLT